MKIEQAEMLTHLLPINSLWSLVNAEFYDNKCRASIRFEDVYMRIEYSVLYYVWQLSSSIFERNDHTDRGILKNSLIYYNNVSMSIMEDDTEFAANFRTFLKETGGPSFSYKKGHLKVNDQSEILFTPSKRTIYTQNMDII